MASSQGIWATPVSARTTPLPSWGTFCTAKGKRVAARSLQRPSRRSRPEGPSRIAEILVDASRTGPLAALIFAVNMLINTDRGDTFSLEEIDGWLRSVGFDHVRTVNAPGLAPRIVLATKPNADHARRPLSAALREPT
jgi:hypothetical protein